MEKVAKKHNLFLIQDAAQSLGSTYQKKPITSFADFTIFSFQAIKQIDQWVTRIPLAQAQDLFGLCGMGICSKLEIM